MGTITKSVQQRMETFQLKQSMLDEFTQSELEDAADYFHQSDKQYGTSELSVPAVVQLQTDDHAAVPAPTTFWERMECLDIAPGILQMPQGISHPGSSSMTLGSGKSQSNMSISGLAPTTEPDSLLIQNAKPVELIRFYLSI